MRIIQSALFERKVKKFSPRHKKILDQTIFKIMSDISLGEEKKGDLQGIYVYKFKIDKTQYLLSYRSSADTLELITIGPHENYYRDLKKYLKS